MELRPEDVQEIVRIFADSQMEELRLDLGATHLHLSKNAIGVDDRIGARAPASSGLSAASSTRVERVSAEPPDDKDRPVASSPALATTDPDDSMYELRSPLLGVFYSRPSPDDSPFVQVGDHVSADDPVCIIEVMKMYTQVPAGAAGKVVEICAEDGQLVETGQVLARIDPQ